MRSPLMRKHKAVVETGVFNKNVTVEKISTSRVDIIDRGR